MVAFSRLRYNKYKPILFVSDDLKWCRKHFSNYKNVRFLDKTFNDNKTITDLTALSMCFQVYGNQDCTFSQLGVILNKNRHVYENTKYAHTFFVDKYGGNNNFYSSKRTRQNRIYRDFRARHLVINCKPLVVENEFNYWYYFNQTIFFFTDKYDWIKKKIKSIAGK